MTQIDQKYKHSQKAYFEFLEQCMPNNPWEKRPYLRLLGWKKVFFEVFTKKYEIKKSEPRRYTKRDIIRRIDMLMVSKPILLCFPLEAHPHDSTKHQVSDGKTLIIICKTGKKKCRQKLQILSIVRK